MPYAPLPRITLADAMAETHPLFPNICPCVECSPQGHSQTPQATIDVKPSKGTNMQIEPTGVYSIGTAGYGGSHDYCVFENGRTNKFGDPFCHASYVTLQEAERIKHNLESTGAPAKRGALPTQSVDVLIERVARRYQ
jgi:hypothetical protein